MGELPLTENNLKQTVNAVEINDCVVRIYIYRLKLRFQEQGQNTGICQFVLFEKGIK